MKSIFYISTNPSSYAQELNYLHNGDMTPISFGAVETYKKNLESIKRKKEWKTQGVGAQFMGIAPYDDTDELENVYVADVTMIDEQSIIYTARLYDGVAVYSKNLDQADQNEGLILRKENMVIHDIDYDTNNCRLAVSCGQPFSYQKHLAILSVDSASMQYITEGDCMDANPVFDKSNPDQLYYDTCGFGFDYNQKIITSPKEICCLNMKTGELDTVLGNEHYDYFKPQFDNTGNLYCIRRPYKEKSQNGSMNLKDIVLVPVKLFRAIFSWLDFFTQRYTGDTLNTATGGNNAAKRKQKSAEELFIEGNIIKVQSALDKNKQAGDTFPGMIPRSWELIKVTSNREISVIKKGVLSYALTETDILYSNGKYLLKHAANQSEKANKDELIKEEKLISKIRT